MKFSTLALSAGLTLVALNASAFNLKFEKTGNDLETKACYAAATDGVKAAKKIVRAEGVNYIELSSTLLCNGMKIKDFANKYAKLQAKSDQAKTVKVVALSAMDRTLESQLCLDAVTMGEKAARTKYNMRNDAIKCNGKDISQFLKTLENTKVVSLQDEDADAAEIASL
jgi:hypothetical protein